MKQYNPLSISAIQMEKILVRMAAQIFELIHFQKELKIIAIQPRGKVIAENLKRLLSIKFNTEVEINTIDPTFFRDDLNTNPKIIIPSISQISLDFQNQCILLIDDVILTGRTIRAAIEAILQIGRPKQIKTMVLINRNLDRETPISIDYEGLRINLNSKTRIKLIELQEHNLQLILENE